MTNLIFQFGLKIAYKILLVYWFLFRPKTEGVYVAVWTEGKILLVKNSYKKYRTLPGGGIGKNESIEQAALRELKEEIGLQYQESNLRLIKSIPSNHEFKDDTVHIFEIQLEHTPEISIDHREIVSAKFTSPKDCLRLPLSPVVRTYLTEKFTQPDLNKVRS